MTPIQIILISAFLFTSLYYFVRLRNRIADVVLLFVLLLTSILVILFPEWVSLIAQRIGVGRGTDLVFYLLVVLFFFVTLKLYSRLRKLEQQITDIIRKQSIEDAKNLKK